MDPTDYIADLEEETRALHSRVVELEKVLRKAREKLRTARERKVEEKEEASGSNLGIGAAKLEVKPEVEIESKEPKLIRGATLPAPTGGRSTVQQQRGSGPTYSQKDDGDVIVVDLSQRSSGKRKGGGDQPSPRPTKRQIFWVEVPPRPKRMRVSPAPVKLEPSTPKGAI